MGYHNTMFNQLLQEIPRHEFEMSVAEHGGDRYVKKFSCWSQFVVLLYAQIRGLKSLREIETGLRVQAGKWYHLGLRSVSRSTISDSNGKRDWRIWEGLFYRTLSRCRDLTPGHKFRFKNPLYALDSTLVSLCLSLYPWARFRRRKGALKIHTLLDQRGTLPAFVVVSAGDRHDVKVAEESDLPLEPDSIIVMDRAYIDFKWLWGLHSRGVWFVTRAKRNLDYDIAGQQEVPKNRGVLFDYSIRLRGYHARLNYPATLRLVGFVDKETGEEFVFLTNHMGFGATTIAEIYKSRWQIELFFKWIKQNLKIKTFLGASFNAVMTQIWVAMIYYLMLAYVKYQTRCRHSMTELSRILRETLMQRIGLIDILSLKPDSLILLARGHPSSQLQLFPGQ